MLRSIPATILRDRQQILRDIYTPAPLSEFPARAARLLAQAVSVDFKGIAEMDYGAQRFRAYREPALTMEEQAELDSVFLAHMEPHPLAAAPEQVMRGTEVVLSQIEGRNRFEKTGLYQEFYKPISVKDELGMSIPTGDGQALCFFMWRDSRGFTKRDLETFAFLRPHVEQAWRNAETIARTGGGCTLIDDVGEAVARGLVLLDCQGRVREWSDRSRALMQKYFTGWRCEPRRLPAPLADWFCLTIAQEAAGKGTATARQPFHFTGATGSLTVRLVNRRLPGEFLLVIEEKQDAPPPAVLSALGLTPRECVIASWLAQGKTNPEIATILGANLLTIKVHLLHIFEKLGVETRTAAAMRIAECWHEVA